MLEIRTFWLRGAAIVLIGVVAVVLAACAHNPVSEGGAGTVLVSPTMVAPWDEVSASLKPAFALTGDQATSQVLPTTESISQQVLTAFGASLAVGLPTTSTTSTTTVGGTNPGSTKTTTSAPGTAPSTTSEIPSGASSLPSATGAAPSLGLDPVLKYKAANYLLQEVQLLNQEIDNAAARTCYVPYVVKLKLALMNYRPKLPYSVHAHIGFFYGGTFASDGQPPRPGPWPPPGGRDLAKECQFQPSNPVVIPLLVADDVQAALMSRAAEAASQIAVGLSAMTHGAGIGTNLSALKQSLTAISNHDLSSALTVGRESDSSLYALITPNNQASNQASLVSETYDVAVLVLIPRSYYGRVTDPQTPAISVTTFSEYRDAKSGELLQQTPRELIAQHADRIIPRYLTPEGREVWDHDLADPQKRYKETMRLVSAVKMADPDTFQQLVGCLNAGFPEDPGGGLSRLCVPDEGDPSHYYSLFGRYLRSSLWTDLATLIDYDPDKLAMFQAQLPTPIKTTSQQVLLNDDGSNPIQVTLGGVSARSIAKLGAFLDITPFDVKSWKSQPPVTVPTQALTLDTTAHTITATFPSLKKLNIKCLAPVTDPPKPPPPKPKAAVAAAPANAIAGDGGATAHAAPAANVDGTGAAPKAATNANGAGAAPHAAPVAPKNTPGEQDTKAEDPDCPVRSSDAGSIDRPNAIRLQLVNCDPSRTLCPSVTETYVADRTGDGWLTEKTNRVLKLQGLLQVELTDVDKEVQSATDDFNKKQVTLARLTDPKNGVHDQRKITLATIELRDARNLLDGEQYEQGNLQLRLKSIADLVPKLEAAAAALADSNAALVELDGAGTKDQKKLTAAREKVVTTRGLWVHALNSAQVAAAVAGLTEYFDDRAIIGVSLIASQQSASQVKVAVANTNDVVFFDNTHAGKLVATFMPTPSTDTIKVTVQGAQLVSIVDSSGSSIPFDAKNGLVISQAGIYTLNLLGLYEAQVVTLTTQALKSGVADGPAGNSAYKAKPATPPTQKDATADKPNGVTSTPGK